MARTHSIRGTGTLLVGGYALGPVSYDLDAYQDSRGKWADGTISADNGLQEAMKSPNAAVIRLADGTEFSVIVTAWQALSTTAEVKSSGPVPGL